MNVWSGGTINNCYNMGFVNAAASAGICSSNSGTINNCYNAGKVKRYESGYIYTEHYYFIGTNVVNNNITVKTPEEMKTQEFVDLLNTLENPDIWEMDTKGINKGFPILSWQAK